LRLCRISRQGLDEIFAAATEYLGESEFSDKEFARNIEEYLEEGKTTAEEILQCAVDYVFYKGVKIISAQTRAESGVKSQIASN